MSSQQPAIVFFGTEQFSLAALKALVEHGFKVSAVVTKPDQPRGRGQKVQPPPIKTYALARGITVWQPTRLGEIADDIKALQPTIGVLVSYGKIIPQSIIDLFAPGIINLHPSLLPKYRGPTPIESAIINGDAQTGVSIMQLSAAMDAGPVYTQQIYDLSRQQTQPELYETLGKIGAKLLVETLPAIIDGSLQPASQDDTLASYCSLLTKQDAWLDTEKLTAQQAEQKIRAHLAYPRTKIAINNHPVTITKAHVAPQADPEGLNLQCRQDWLVIDEVIAPSGKTMAAADFQRGYM